MLNSTSVILIVLVLIAVWFLFHRTEKLVVSPSDLQNKVVKCYKGTSTDEKTCYKRIVNQYYKTVEACRADGHPNYICQYVVPAPAPAPTTTYVTSTSSTSAPAPVVPQYMDDRTATCTYGDFSDATQARRFAECRDRASMSIHMLSNACCQEARESSTLTSSYNVYR
jgi:hypothetical protein